jgi:RND family efflux transporter MFP subunit
MKKKLIAVTAFIGLGVLLYIIAGGFTPKLPTEAMRAEGEAVNGRTLITVAMQSLPLIESYAATTVADQTATLSARITARVADVLVDVGDEVKSGDILLQLDNTDLDARVAQTEQAIVSSQAQLNNARKEYQRLLTLKKGNAVSQSQLDLAEANLKAMQAQARQAQASLTEAKATLGYSLITAPFDGVITRKLVELGDVASPGVAMLELYNPASVVVEAAIPVSRRQLITIGDRWSVTIEGEAEPTLATVAEISPAADRGARAVTIRLSIDDEVARWPGIFSRVALQTGETEALVIPAEYVYRIGQNHYVKQVIEGQAYPRLVKVKPAPAPERLIVTQGIRSGDQLLLP